MYFFLTYLQEGLDKCCELNYVSFTKLLEHLHGQE